jgi:hypothetical protein
MPPVGLDITAYSRLKHLGKHETVDDADGCEYDAAYNRVHVEAYAYAGFEASFRGIPILGTETYGTAQYPSEFIAGGCYEVTPETQTHGFRAGSYSGYNAWRADLQRQFNPAVDEDGPFFELIYFADNEGCIGPEAAKDLLEDFRLHFERYMSGAHADYFTAKYQDWTRAFELAADGGLVDFH